MDSPQLATALAARFAAIRDVIEANCARVHRDPGSVTLLAVSKTHPPTLIAAAVECAQTHFGENRVEEAASKIDALTTLLGAHAAALTWHMIGHVQSRKAREVARCFQVVHSVDGLKLGERLARFRQETHPAQPLRILLEMNVSGEQSKSGFDAVGWADQLEKRRLLWHTIEQLNMLPHLQLEGLMTMAPIVDDPEQARPVFAGLRALRDALVNDISGLHLPQLSMGMSDDYPVAIEEGATIVRIGRALFGERQEE